MVCVNKMETIINAKILTGKQKFSVVFNKEKNLLIVEATEKPENNKANKEILKKLKKYFKADIEIVSGLKSKEKTIKVALPENKVMKKLETQANSIKPL
ncbi:MAG: DUF167 domain-containing protein [archaeon]